MEHDKPIGVAAAQAMATDIGLAMQTVEGFPTKQLQWDRSEAFYVYEDRAGAKWYVGNRQKPVGNPFHFVARCDTEDEAIGACLQWNRGPQ